MKRSAFDLRATTNVEHFPSKKPDDPPTENDTLILLSHIGPGSSSTTVDQVRDPQPILSGSPYLSDVLSNERHVSFPFPFVLFLSFLLMRKRTLSPTLHFSFSPFMTAKENTSGYSRTYAPIYWFGSRWSYLCDESGINSVRFTASFSLTS